MLSENFFVQVIFNNDQLSELKATRPTPELLEAYSDFLTSKTTTLIKLNKSQILDQEASNKIVIPFKRVFDSSEKPLKRKKKEEESMGEISDDFEELSIKDLEDIEIDPEDDFLEDDLERLTISSGTEKKLTKR
jgi:hypothetical protein